MGQRRGAARHLHAAMLRRQARQRREFLYNKALEAKSKQIYERKQRVKDLLAKGKEVPKRDAVGERESAMDAAQEDPMTHIDDEYGQAGIEDPKVLVTTSRDPSSKLSQFAKEIRLCIPNSKRITDLVVLHEHRGVPDAMVVSHFPYGPTLYFTLSNVVLRHSLENVHRSTVSEQFPHLIFEGFGSKLGERVRNVLKFLYPVPKEDSKRTVTFINEGDFISFRHHVFVKTAHRE